MIYCRQCNRKFPDFSIFTIVSCLKQEYKDLCPWCIVRFGSEEKREYVKRFGKLNNKPRKTIKE